MKRYIWLSGLVMLVMTAAWGDEPKETAEYLFQKALYLETAKADYQGAIPVYETIVKEYKGDDLFAAKALYRLGICYEKTGQSEKAEQCAGKLEREYVAAVKADAEIAEFTRRNLEGKILRSRTFEFGNDSMDTIDRKQIINKLNTIILPSIEFKDAILPKVLDTLKEQSSIYDKSPASEPKGISFGILGDMPSVSQWPPSVTISLRNVSLMDALESITKAIDYEFIVTDAGVYLTALKKFEIIKK